jgi:hypothetical protein
MRFRTSASPARSTRLGAKLEILAVFDDETIRI